MKQISKIPFPDELAGKMSPNQISPRISWKNNYSRTKILTLILIGFILPGALFSQTKWQQTSATVSFSIKNRGSDVDGHFGNIHTTLLFSPDKLSSSSLKGELDVNTISTGIAKRDKDLKGPGYFDGGTYKMITVSSKSINRKGSGYVGTFNVTIKGKTKQLEIPFEFTENGNSADFKGTLTVSRQDFGIGGKSGLAMFMGDDAHVTIDVKANKQ